MFGKPPPPPPPLPSIPFAESIYAEMLMAIVVPATLMILLKIKVCFFNPKPSQWVKPPASDVVPYKKGEAPFTVDPKGVGVVRVAESGVASFPPTTLNALFKAAAVNFPTKPAMRMERDGEWRTWTWSDYYSGSEQVAKALIALGFEPHDCVNVIGFNSPAWFMAQMGAILAGGKAAGVYTTNEAAACRYVAEHSEAKFVFLEDTKQLDKYLTFYKDLPKLKGLVMWNASLPSAKSNALTMEWETFVSHGKGLSKEDVELRSSKVVPGQCVTLIYTSGTTGNPKAVMISHDNMIYESLVAMDTLFVSDAAVTLPLELRIVSYLPLSHVAAQMLDIATPIVITGSAASGGGIFAKLAPHWYTTWFARPDALKGTLKTTLVAARPTAFLGVPRVWEKIRETLLEIGRKNTGFKKTIAAWAKRHAAAAAKERQLGGSGATTVSYLLAKLVLSKIRAALGLDQCLFCATAAAPMPREVAEYFASIDIDILDIYGMSECTGATTASTNSVHQFGTVGAPLGSSEIRIDHVAGRDKPSEGEICYRGRHIMLGYMKEQAKTAEAIDADGWLHSGDVGIVDNDGLLHITGRIKELIITAGGENIAPVPIEDKLKELCPALSNVMMVGDKRKYNVVLFTVKTELNPETGMSTGKLVGDAARVSSATTDVEVIAEVAKGGPWKLYLQKGLDEQNKNHTVSNAQKIQKFTVLPGDFSEKGGELTATLKLKRSVTADKYAKEIDAMF